MESKGSARSGVRNLIYLRCFEFPSGPEPIVTSIPTITTVTAAAIAKFPAWGNKNSEYDDDETAESKSQMVVRQVLALVVREVRIQVSW